MSNYSETRPTSMMSKISKKVRHYILILSFTMKGVRLPILAKRHALKKASIKLYWWAAPNINNFGDTVSKDIILNLFGRNIVFAPLEECDIVAAGSILELAGEVSRNSKFYVWGSGFIRKDSHNINLDRAVFKAVRGQKTIQRIEKNVPTGDPGILIAPTYLLRRKKHSKNIGVIIHYADKNTAIAKKISKDSRFTIIDPLDEPRNVAEKISNCGLILSSSLHGLIFADSLSIPNIHIKISQNITGGNYKFEDYYSGIGKKYIQADISKIFSDEYLKEIKQEYRPIPHLAKKQRSLIKTFPF